MTNIVVRPIDIHEVEDARLWDAFVEQVPGTSFFHYSAWMKVIQNTYGHRPHYLLATLNGRVTGILPLILMRTGVFSKALVSLPFADYGGICADSEITYHKVLSEAKRCMETCGAHYVELRKITPPLDGDAGRLDKIGLVLDLTKGTDELWRSLPGKVRNQVRKAQKCGLTAEFRGIEALDDFYRVFRVNMRDLGSPVHSKAFFKSMFYHFPDKAKFIIVRDGSTPIGGAVCCFFKATMLVPWASSLRDHFSKCPNNLLYWEAIRYGSNHGFKVFDFGRSSKDSNTFRFKVQWGARAIQLYWVYYTKQRKPISMPSLDTEKYSLLAEVWKKLPVPVTSVIGPQIRKYISN